jgi:protein Mpv17
MLTYINTFLRRRPLLVSLVSNTTKTAAADLITQTVIEDKKELDFKRLGLFTTFGFAYLGGWQYFLFNKAFVRCEKHMTVRKYGRGTSAAVLTFLDLGFHTPLLYFPSFYALKGYIDGTPMTETVTKYKSNITEDMISMWKLWLPAQMVNFSCVPIHMRMPFITCVSFAWTIVLSMQRGVN